MSRIVAIERIYQTVVELAGALARRTEIRKFKTIDAANASLVEATNSVPMLPGRTSIVAATRP